jgi:hypothetical protein
MSAGRNAGFRVAHIESFNGKFRDECVNAQWFESLTKPGKTSRAGGATTTRSHHTARLTASRPHSSQHQPEIQ